MRAVVVSHGEVDPGDVAHVRGADLVIAADGGTVHLERWGIAPQLVVGDLDSLPPGARERIAAAGGSVEPHPRQKDRTDTEIALDRAIGAGADEVVVVGALGGPRIDHAMANTLLLARDAVAIPVRLVRGPMTMRLLRGGERLELAGETGEVVTLLPVGGDADGVVTGGLRYQLRNEALAMGSSRGVSNEIERPPAWVSCGSGALLVIEGGAIPPA
ncbi:MAG: thiamine diphosphokinase [Candidatus Limnocylindria bacterium]